MSKTIYFQNDSIFEENRTDVVFFLVPRRDSGVTGDHELPSFCGKRVGYIFNN